MTGLRILVVDDDEDFAETIADVLESRHHSVDLAHSGERALELARNSEFDLVFMDVRLPGMNGVDSFIEIQKLQPSLRFIIMTGFSVEQLLDRALEHGAWAVLKKPLDIAKILKMVDRITPEGSVWIVDDDQDFANTVRDVLLSVGYSVAISTTGASAIEGIRKGPADLVLLDIRLPDIDGLEVFLQIREAHPTLPVIIVTGYPEDEAGKVTSINSKDRTGVIVKPVDAMLLRKTVDAMIANPRTEDSDLG